MGTLSRLWKGLKDIKNALDVTVAVTLKDHIKLIEQAALHLEQASSSIFCSRCLQALKSLRKNPKKVNNNRVDVLNCPSSSANLFTVKLFSTATNKISELGFFIPDKDR